MEEGVGDVSFGVNHNRGNIVEGGFFEQIDAQACFTGAGHANNNGVVDVDDLGNRFEVTGFAPGDIEACPKGFLSGRYRLAAASDRPARERSEFRESPTRLLRRGQLLVEPAL